MILKFCCFDRRTSGRGVYVCLFCDNLIGKEKKERKEKEVNNLRRKGERVKSFSFDFEFEAPTSLTPSPPQRVSTYFLVSKKQRDVELIAYAGFFLWVLHITLLYFTVLSLYIFTYLIDTYDRSKEGKGGKAVKDGSSLIGIR